MWNVIGHNKNKKYFQNAVKTGQLVHAYLFSGPEMIGKKMFACELVKLINNRGPENNPDLKQIGTHIEDIRNLKSFLSIKPFYGPYKITIIDDADKMTAEASNSLLKILEEPSSSSLIILVTSKPGHLLPTIYSRCYEVKFQPLKERELEDLMPNKLKPEDKILLKTLAYNRPGWIINNLENLNNVRKSIQEFDKILQQGIFEKIQYTAKIYEKENYIELINNLIYWHYSQDRKPAKLLGSLIQVSKVISQPQYNHRLALENFLINN